MKTRNGQIFPVKKQQPKLTNLDVATQAALDLIKVLKTPHLETPALIGSTKMKALI